MDTQGFFNQHAKNKERTSQYLIGKKFNTQDGDKTEQNYYVKLLPRIPNKESELCKGPFYEFWVHRDCGPDANQALVCLNRNRDEFKANKRHCPACSKVRKILNDEASYSTETIERAKKQRGQNRVVWIVYNLNSREGCEILEQSGQANDSIIGQFKDQGGDFLDLTLLKNKTALNILRKGSGMQTKYLFSGLQHDKFALTNSDGAKIKATVIHPEAAVKRLSAEEFKEVFETQFEVETASTIIDDGPQPPAAGEGSGDLDDLSNMSDAPAPAAAGKVNRQAQAAPAATPAPAATDDLESTLDDLTA